ncbi:Os07g0446600 [Oryza sativa Japonica Group]|uniref:Os07g0446600 protein n=2 Tax=Oryza sativa subsp. japonica TaxID=39947 RepID=Q0D6S2_ORYSJ|nr:hypothetical protein EE612_038921 [Oryza sativa]BAF21451.1 Os07g0446600 [Oryza sativa Japonica Group]BAT01293.1 Os07g0446600 [Oryza sativa Japonica Group]|eukprot:NP_001059537.1 Os07g0446600 [Oryza sativa Japonica Group]
MGEMNWVSRKIHLYNVTMGLYMLDWWERCLFSILFHLTPYCLLQIIIIAIFLLILSSGFWLDSIRFGWSWFLVQFVVGDDRITEGQGGKRPSNWSRVVIF